MAAAAGLVLGEAALDTSLADAAVLLMVAVPDISSLIVRLRTKPSLADEPARKKKCIAASVELARTALETAQQEAMATLGMAEVIVAAAAAREVQLQKELTALEAKAPTQAQPTAEALDRLRPEEVEA